MTIYAKAPFILHLLAGSANISALDAAKALLDSGRRDANECEPDEQLSVLHVAAAWDNLAMCQLLVHYGADIDAVDKDGRRPIDLANGRSRKFLKKFCRKNRKERNQIRRIFAFLFGRACLEPKNLNASTFSSAYRPAQRSCPILPSAPALHDVLVANIATAPPKEYDAESRMTSTSSYVTANDGLSSFVEALQPLTKSINNEKRRSSLSSTVVVAAAREQRKISTENGVSIARRSVLFSNVTLRRQRKEKPYGTDDEPMTRERTRSSLSCATADRAYLSSDHTTPRYSDNDLLLAEPSSWMVSKYGAETANTRFSRSIRSERLKSFGPQNELNLYPDLYADIQRIAPRKDQKNGVEKRALPSAIEKHKDDKAIGFYSHVHRSMRPYNEMLSEVAARLAALDLDRTLDPSPDEILQSGTLDGEDEQKGHLLEELRIRDELSAIGLEELRRRLIARRCSVGPINSANRQLYETKLARIEVNILHGDGSGITKYSHALQTVLRNEHRPAVAELVGEAEEHELRQHFQAPVAVGQVSCFCYFFIDPSMIVDFQRCSLREFIDAIFYVGKGTGSRPFTHLIDAYNLRRAVVPKKSEKIRRILDLWDQKIGVVSLQICQNVHADEALIRERCMIDAIGIENLTNVRRGKATGLPVAWTQRRITELGAHLLRRAHMVIRHERCRPIMEAEVAAMSPYRPPNAALSPLQAPSRRPPPMVAPIP